MRIYAYFHHTFMYAFESVYVLIVTHIRLMVHSLPENNTHVTDGCKVAVAMHVHAGVHMFVYT